MMRFECGIQDLVLKARKAFIENPDASYDRVVTITTRNTNQHPTSETMASRVSFFQQQEGNLPEFKRLFLKARKAYIENPAAPYYRMVPIITNHLILLKNNEPAEVKPKQSSILPTFAVQSLLCLAIIFGVLGVYLQSNPENHQPQMGMQLFCCFLDANGSSRQRSIQTARYATKHD
jgi:hypothetical protein